MNSRCLGLLSIVAVAILSAAAHAATPVDGFPSGQRWRAEDYPLSEPSFLNVYEVNGWGRSTGGTWAVWPATVDGLPAEVEQTGNPASPSTSGKYSNEFSIPADAANKTIAVWRLRVNDAAAGTPVIKVRCGTHRVRLNFSSALNPGTCLVTSGWTADDSATTDTGGLVDLTGGKRFLPMSMRQWHTLRVEVDPTTGRFTAWVDPEGGFSDRARISGPANPNTSHEIKFAHTETKSGFNQVATNCFGWIQQAASLPEGAFETCNNGVDDDGDGLADNADPHCFFTGTLENTPAVCADGIDQDCDGLIDCADPDCAGVITENSAATCADGIDQDCDGLIDCADPDCAAIAHCDYAQPEFVLTLARQLGDWQNCGGGCRQVYFSVYDENGTPLDGVTIKDAINGCTVITKTDRGQAGHATFPAEAVPACDGGVLLNKTYRFYVSSYLGNTVASEVTPDLFAWLPPDNPFYSWQFEFILKEHRYNPVTFTPLDPAYIFDGVEFNTPPGPNNTLLDDFCGLSLDDGSNPAPASTVFGQTFVANGNRIVSVRAEVSNGFQNKLQYQASIHPLLADPPLTVNDIGPAIGPARSGPAMMQESEWQKQMILWPVEGDDSVPVVPGQKYFLKIMRSDPAGTNYPLLTAFGSINWYDGLGIKHSGDRYPNGERYRLAADGVSLVVDLYPAIDKGYYDMTAYVVAATVGEATCERHNPVFDINDDGYVDAADFTFFESCATTPGAPASVWDALSAECKCMDRTGDQSIDQQDFAVFQRCVSGTGVAADPTCDD